jgi:two-component system, OmpR family, response regulator
VPQNAAPMRLLLLEDDPILGEGLRDYLRVEGHVVDWFTRLADVKGLANEPYDALLVDWQLPDGSGLDWVRSLREREVRTPALMLTARDLVAERVGALDAGLDDYLVKPFAPEELVARIRAVCRRAAGTAGPRKKIGEVEIDLSARSAYVAGKRAELTAREWTVLEALLHRAGRIVPKSDLEALMLGFDGELSSNALEVHVSGIRRKLGPAIIETVRGLGYRIASSP